MTTKKGMIYLLRKLLAVSLLLALFVVPSYGAAPDKDIIIVFTNDVHCGVEDHIGYAGFALYRNEMRELTPYVTTVDAGDFAQGATIGMIAQGRYIVEIMNEIGYDIVVPGNHDFDYSIGMTENFNKNLSCGLISCNFKTVADDKPVFNPYKILTYGDTKIAYIGATTPETISKSTPSYFMDKNREKYIYTFDGDLTGEKLIADIQKAVDEVRAKGVDYVIVVGHLGEYEDVTEVWSAPFIAARTRGIDVFIDGHSHEVTPEMKIKNADGKEVIITQSGTKLAHIGQVTIAADGKISSKLIDSSNGKDEEVDIAIQKIKGRFEDTLKAHQGHTNFDLRAMDDEGTWLLRDAETNLCDLVTDALLDSASMTKTGKADISLINAGGIRTNIMTGEITFNDVLSVLPFGNTVYMVEVSGQVILDELEVGARLAPQRNGGLLHASGLTYTIDTRIPTPVKMDKTSMFSSMEGERRVKDVKVNGEVIDPDRIYKVVSLNYVLIEHGDGHMFKGTKIIEANYAVASDVLGRYIRKLSEIPEVYENIGGQGRLTIIQ